MDAPSKWIPVELREKSRAVVNYFALGLGCNAAILQSIFLALPLIPVGAGHEWADLVYEEMILQLIALQLNQKCQAGGWVAKKIVGPLSGFVFKSAPDSVDYLWLSHRNSIVKLVWNNLSGNAEGVDWCDLNFGTPATVVFGLTGKSIDERPILTIGGLVSEIGTFLDLSLCKLCP